MILWQWDWRIWGMRRSWESLVIQPMKIIQPIKIRLRGIISVCTEVNRRWSQSLLGDRRGRRHGLKYMKFYLNLEKRHFMVKMEQVAQRSCGGPILRDTRNPAEGPEEPVPAAPVWARSLHQIFSRVLSYTHKYPIPGITQADQPTCTHTSSPRLAIFSSWHMTPAWGL